LLGLAGQIKDLKRRLIKSGGQIDIACQFHVVIREGTKLKRTGLRSKVYGGKYDIFRKHYIAPPSLENVIHFDVSEKQFELIQCDSPRIEGNGGRGGAKSEGGLRKVVRKICELPWGRGEISAPVYRILKIDWIKIKDLIPFAWLKGGRKGFRLTDREVHLINGHTLRFVSTDNPDALRSWGGDYAFIDEEQDVLTEAVDIIWPSLRETDTPQLWTCGTPKKGEFHDRHKKLLEDPDSVVIQFDSYSNPFISHRVFELAKQQMDERTYRQEILAEWIVDEDENLIFYCFSREKHQTAWPPSKAKDITREYSKKKAGTAKSFIVGVDYNWDYPNYAVIYKILEGNRWVAIDIVATDPQQGESHAGFLAKALKDRGYGDSVIVDDATGQYGKGSRSSFILLRRAGFVVLHRTKNPNVTDRISAVLVKMAPVQGEITFFLALPRCEELALALESLVWAPNGKNLDKTAGLDHVVDAATYPIAFFEPTTRISRFRSINIMAA
jgi:hypothetical protein